VGPLIYLLDSVILIECLNGHPEAFAWLRSNVMESAVSAVTRAEVLVGGRRAELETARRLLDKFPFLPIDQSIADRAAALRRWRLPDAFQAAIAHQHGLTLATRNSKDFPPKRFPFVRVPY
jgi:hypothetical protein